MIKHFRVKLILFTLSVTLVPLISIVILFLNNFNTITEVSTEQNKKGLTSSTIDYLTSIVEDKAEITSLKLQSIIDGVSILGESTQRIIDNYDDFPSGMPIHEMELFENKLREFHGSRTTFPDAEVNVFVPPHVVDNPDFLNFLNKTSLLNLVMVPLFKSNSNFGFIYFVGDETNDITRAYPNNNIAEKLHSDGIPLDLNFWKDYFPDNLPPWTKFYTDEKFSQKVLSRTGSLTTFNQPYGDAAGGGKVITVFYPLWNKQQNRFAGAVGADVSLANIVDSILSVRIAKTGYAFLINSAGEIIAQPDQAQADLLTEEQVLKRSGLDYYYRSLHTSKNASIQEIYQDIISEESGFSPVLMGNGEKGLLKFDSIIPINTANYEADSWKIVMITPEKEIFETLIETEAVIRNQNNRTTLISLIAVIVTVMIIIVLTYYLSGNITSDITALSIATKKIAEKNYDIKIKTKATDEIGQLGNAFTLMSKEIKTYTENLEEKVSERTKDLEKAMGEIHELNAKLSDENRRMSAELEVAQQLQLMVLPSDEHLKGFDNIDIAGIMEPADEVGGDYYDVFQFKDSTIIGIGDVTGHGLSSGVVMLMAQSAIKTAASLGKDNLKQILSVVNSVLCDNIDRLEEEKTMTLALIDYKDNEYNIVGQHETVIICRNNGAVEVIDTLDLGYFIGIERDIDDYINEFKVRLEEDDVIVLYTDGVVEAVNNEEEEYGCDRLAETIQKSRDMDSRGILNFIMADLKSYIGETKIYDDISIVVIKQKNRKNKMEALNAI